MFCKFKQVVLPFSDLEWHLRCIYHLFSLSIYSRRMKTFYGFTYIDIINLVEKRCVNRKPFGGTMVVSFYALIGQTLLDKT